MRVRVGFSQGTTWIGKLICWGTHTDISHSFFLVEDEEGAWVYEAAPFGFRRMSWTEYQETNYVKALVDMDWPHAKVKQALDEMLGTRYALLTFLILAAGILLKRVVRRPRLLARYGMDCVSSVCRVMARFGLDVIEPISPAELRDRIGKKNNISS